MVFLRLPFLLPTVKSFRLIVLLSFSFFLPFWFVVPAVTFSLSNPCIALTAPKFIKALFIFGVVGPAYYLCSWITVVFSIFSSRASLVFLKADNSRPLTKSLSYPTILLYTCPSADSPLESFVFVNKNWFIWCVVFYLWNLEKFVVIFNILDP